jgi:hypothetical protein
MKRENIANVDETHKLGSSCIQWLYRYLINKYLLSLFVFFKIIKIQNLLEACLIILVT